MAVLMILLMAGLAAMAVLLRCLKGFTRALGRKKVAGVFVKVEEETGRRTPRRPSQTLVDFPQQKSRLANDPDRQRISPGHGGIDEPGDHVRVGRRTRRPTELWQRREESSWGATAAQLLIIPLV